MAITIEHTYSTHVTAVFLTEDDTTLRYNDVGTMDEVAERAINTLVKHDFIHVDITDENTGELVMVIDRT